MSRKEARTRPQLAEHQQEISRDILVIVLLVIIFVSILGTWTILSALDKVPKPAGMSIVKGSTGNVVLEIEGIEKNNQESSAGGG